MINDKPCIFDTLHSRNTEEQRILFHFFATCLLYTVDLEQCGGGGVKGTKPCTLKNQHKTSDPPQP